MAQGDGTRLHAIKWLSALQGSWSLLYARGTHGIHRLSGKGKDHCIVRYIYTPPNSLQRA